MRISALSALALLLATSTVAGCGSSSSGSPVAVDSSAPTTAAASPTPAADPSLPVPSTPAKPTRTPTRAAGGNGDADATPEPAAAGGGICAGLTEAEMGALVGGTVDGVALSGGGCSFNQKRPERPAAGATETAFSQTPGGMDGAKTNATSSVEGTPVDVPGIGDEAFVVTGTAFGGDDVQGAGAVRVGDRLVSVYISQSTGLPAKRVRSLVLDLLKLVATKLG